MPVDRSKFIDQFKDEIREHLRKLNQRLLELEQTPVDRKLLEVLIREAHTVKGSATMMGYRRIADIGHKMEDGFESVLNGKIEMRKAHFDLIFECLDTIEALLEDKVTWEDKGVDQEYREGLFARLDDVFSGRKVAAQRSKKAGKQRSKEVKLSELTGEESLRVDKNKLDKLVNFSGELIISKIRLNELISSLTEKAETRKDMDGGDKALIRELKTAEENIDYLVSNMQTEIIGLRMVALSYLFDAFPRAMRDLAAGKGKGIEFKIKGDQTRLDKSIIDGMKDPLMHLLRNAVDHGIEKPEIRRKKDKPEIGRITLNAFQEGSQVVIEVSDDGKGMDAAAIAEQAVNMGLISEGKASEMVDGQIFQFLFTPGFSTKKTVTSISGRGVGLDVVREKIAKMKGMIEISSVIGTGTKFTIKLPLTLAITKSLLIVSGSEEFAIPIETIVETIRIRPDEINTVETKEAITVRDHIMPLIRINDLFGLSARGISEKKFFQVVVVQFVEKKMALLVDQLLGHQGIVTKPLGYPLRKTRNIAGGTILGDGRVVLILDIHSIVEFAEGEIVKRSEITPKRQPVKKRKKMILLAEDVLSTAMLEKNILESAGFSVVVVRDGEEALKAVTQERFDLIITDILMSKIDGFELTRKLKADKMYKDVPVIIVTTRERDIDKKRGLEAGAEAYILKSEFTSEGLLDVIERLIG